MPIAHKTPPPELQDLLTALECRLSVVHTKTRLLRGLAPKLEAVVGLGFTGKELWETLTPLGYEGSYRQFNRALRQALSPATPKPKRKDLPSPIEEKKDTAPEPAKETTAVPERPQADWERRREAARRSIELDLERAEALQQPRRKLFVPSFMQER